MNRQRLIEQIKKKKTNLIIGLDSDIDKVPEHLLRYPDPIFEFNTQIIQTTHDLCVGYKINTAFYEARGSAGWLSLEKTDGLLRQKFSDSLVIADAKRGDIGNTAKQYAKAFFESMNFDAITVAPYMGKDSVQPFLDVKDKWTIVLGLTSNEGANDFQFLKSGDKKVFEHVLTTASTWGTPENQMFVIGATQAEALIEVRKILPHHFLLIPGVGAQGGSLEDVYKYGMNADCGILVNSSREIIYASDGENFASEARKAAQKMQTNMAKLIDQYCPIPIGNEVD